MDDRYNLVVIGGGAAGLVSAYIAAAVKARVALIEREHMGGDCLNFGCVPSKAFIKTAKFVHDMRRHQDLGVKDVRFELDFPQIMARVRQKIDYIAPVDSVERYTSLGVNCFTGDATLLDPHTVEVNGKKLKAKNIVLALGASPRIPPIKGIENVSYLTSENLWGLRTLPKQMVVLGGGPIGCEMAQAFQRLGSQVHLVEMGPRLLPKEDVEISQYILEAFQKEGVRVHTQTKAVAIEQVDGRKVLVCEQDGGQLQINFDEILVAVGRKPRTDGVDWSRLGISLRDDGAIAVDDYLRTGQKHIYACGDVIGHYQLTHTASHQAWFCAVNALFSPLKKFKVDYRVIPWCTFTDPEVARVGLSEAEARQRGIPYEITRYELSHLDRAITESENHGFVKVLTPPGKDQILGAVIVGHLAGELLAEFVAGMKHGFGLNKILGTIHSYPTFMEANKYAAGVWKKNNAPAWALRFLERFHSWRR